MKTLILLFAFTLFFKTAEVHPVEMPVFVEPEKIPFNEAEYLDRICSENDINIKAKPPIEHLLHLQAMIKKYNLPERLIYRQVYQESRYHSHLTSNKGAWGYMQTMPETFCDEANKLGLDSSVLSNIEVGCYYMRQMLDKFGSDSLALAAYNSGPARVERLKRVPRIAETKEYVKFIMQ